jgi:hypothetical protein
MIGRVLGTLAVLLVYAWTLHSVVLAGDQLLAQHPLTMLRTSPAQSHLEPVKGYRQAIDRAELLLPVRASVAIVHRSYDFTDNYAYYWATYHLYPRHIVIAQSSATAAGGAPDYILDVRDWQKPAPDEPNGYRILNTMQFPDGTILTILAHG